MMNRGSMLPEGLKKSLFFLLLEKPKFNTYLRLYYLEFDAPISKLTNLFK